MAGRLSWVGMVLLRGGYPVIAVVVIADLARLAQLKPGDTLQFMTIEVERARALAAAEWMIKELA